MMIHYCDLCSVSSVDCETSYWFVLNVKRQSQSQHECEDIGFHLVVVVVAHRQSQVDSRNGSC